MLCRQTRILSCPDLVNNNIFDILDYSEHLLVSCSPLLDSYLVAMAILPWTLLSPSSSPTLLRLPSFCSLTRTFLFVLIFIWTHPFSFQSNTHPIHYHLSTLFCFCSRSPLPFFKKVSFQHTPRSLLSTSRAFTNPAIDKQRATRKPWIPGIWRRHLDLRFTGLY